jgi:tetratricopeptide (TPR) repeat protein
LGIEVIGGCEPLFNRLWINACIIALLLQFTLVPANLADESLNTAIALYTSKDYKGASESFYRMAQANPSPTATYYLALCYEQLHYHPQAVELFGRICKQWPASDEARQSTDYLQKLNDLAGARKENAAAPNPDPATALANALNKPISRAEWEALPAKVRFPITREHGHMMVTAKINGKYCKLAFDTEPAFAVSACLIIPMC